MVFTTLLASFLASAVAMSVGYVFARRLRRVDVVDVYWGVAIIAASLTGLLLSPHLSMHRGLVFLLIVIWGCRLSLHIARRFRQSSKQDERYTYLMASWPSRHLWLQVYCRIFLVQALLATVVALPMIAMVESVDASILWLCVGIFVWLSGFVIESFADAQLAVFLASSKNRGALMTRGLWRYSRHPNYFGEIVLWWGIWLTTVGTESWLITLCSPMLVSVLLRFVSGVPLAERRAATKPGWHAYRRKTSLLLPLPLRH